MMDVEDENENEGASSPESVIARADYEAGKRLRLESTSGEYCTAAETSLSMDGITRSLEMSTSISSPPGDSASPQSPGSPEEKKKKKKKRFDALKNTFRRDSGFFKVKKKTKSVGSDASAEIEFYEEDSAGSYFRTVWRGIHICRPNTKICVIRADTSYLP